MGWLVDQVAEHSIPRRLEVLRRDDRAAREVLLVLAGDVAAEAAQVERQGRLLAPTGGTVGLVCCGHGRTPRMLAEVAHMDQPAEPAVAEAVEQEHRASPWEPLARRTPAVAAVRAVADLHPVRAAPAWSSSLFRGLCNGPLR